MRNIKSITKLVSCCATVLLVASLAAGCSVLGLNGNANTQSTSSVVPSSGVEEKISGGELFIAMPAASDSFDPLEARTEDMIDLLSLVYETPMQYSADGKLTENLVSYYEVNADKTEFMFYLREGVYFGDGTTMLDAEDVVYSAHRVRDLDGSVWNQPPADGDESGDSPDEEPSEPAEDPEPEESAEPDTTRIPTQYEQYNEFVSYIEAVDQYTVKLTMNTPGNDGLHFMTFPVVNEELFTQQDIPVGTGPYVVESYESSEETGRRMTLVVNGRWRKPAPYIERIVAQPMSGDEEKLQAIEASLLDFITTDSLNASQYARKDRVQMVDYMTNYYDCVVPNLDLSTLADVNVRQAISAAIDRRQVISTVLLNHAVPVSMPVAPDYFAYDVKYKVNDFDQSRAKELLRESGYQTEENGEGSVLTLRMIVADNRDYSYRKEAAKAIVKQLGEVGIAIELEILPSDQYLERLRVGDFELAYCSFYLDIVPNPQALFTPGEPLNFGNVDSSELNTAMQNCALAVTEEETIAAYEQLQKILSEQMPQIGICYRMNSILCDETIHGITGARQDMVFSEIREWYFSYLGEAALPAPSATADPDAAETGEPQDAGITTDEPHETEPEEPEE